MEVLEGLDSYVNFLESDMRHAKQSFIYSLDSIRRTMETTKERIESTLDDPTDVGSLNPLGILQSQGQRLDLSCMELVSKAKHLHDVAEILNSLQQAGGE